MPKSSWIRFFAIAFIVFGIVAAGIWVVSEPGDISVKANENALGTSPYTEKMETPSSMETLTIDVRVLAEKTLLIKLQDAAHLKMTAQK